MDTNDIDLIGGGDVLQELVADSLRLLRSARHELSLSLEAMRQGDASKGPAVIKDHKELTAALRVALETERKLDDWIAKNTGNEGDDPEAFDFDAARNDIGCRLDRLRACCHSE